MKQKIKIAAIIKDSSNRIIVLKNKDNLFEIPQSSMNFSEQPESCLDRALVECFGRSPEKVKIKDAISYVSPGETKRKSIYLYVLYEVFYKNVETISLDKNNSRYFELDYIQQEDYIVDSQLTDSTNYVLNIFSQYSDIIRESGKSNEREEKYQLFVDGGSRGNPGISAAGFVLLKSDEKIDSGGEFLGITDNAQAEYHSLKIGLEAAIKCNIKNLSVYMDNLMVVNQINGIYKVKNRGLWPIYSKIKELSRDFYTLSVSHVRRENNTLADKEVNKILDLYSNHKNDVV